MSRRTPRIHVGTSGWSYSDWKGAFYPEDRPESQWLEYYASIFDTVELNASFYRLPFENMITSWNRRLPEGFHFVAKGSRLITHRKKLTDVDENLRVFFDRMGRLKTLRVVLWQLPPSLHFDPERLDGFLGRLPERWRHAVEFRHVSWWRDETLEVLGRHRASFVIVSHPRLPDDVLVSTDFLYVRFHGAGKNLYDYDYSRKELRQWAERLRPKLRGRALYAFFNNDVHAHAPANALAFRSMLLPAPRRPNRAVATKRGARASRRRT